jgi:hypothetical protein
MNQTPVKIRGKRSNSDNEGSQTDDDSTPKKQYLNDSSFTPSNSSIVGTPIQFTPMGKYVAPTPNSYPQDTQDADYSGIFSSYTDIDVDSITGLLNFIKEALSYKNYEEIIHRHKDNPDFAGHAQGLIYSFWGDQVMNPEVYNLIKLSVMRKIKRRMDRYYSKKEESRKDTNYELIPIESLLNDLAEHKFDKANESISLPPSIQLADIPDIKERIHSNQLLYERLKKIYTIGSGIDGCHDSDSLAILDYIRKISGTVDPQLLRAAADEIRT